MRLTIDEYSKHFKMSKEMINSKLKAKKLDYIIEDGVTYIVPTDTLINKKKSVATKKDSKVSDSVVLTNQQKQRTTVATVLSLYQKENLQLKAKVLQLEAKIDKLIDDKEQMLRDERDKIEEVYSTKDEQLKTILELINAKMMMQQPTQLIHEVQTTQTKELSKNKESSELVELREYLKTLDIKSHQRKSIKRKFMESYDSDVRIIQQNGKLYLDFSKYDYSDLLAY
ncbi:MAG: hypothetical protein U9P72_05045 [Campylobacterota bacterium]|nr:hypothetical protein [Campylobacterota bacterium]